MVKQTKQALPQGNRGACKSAAMIGLAISMGASSFLVTRQGDRVLAAEPAAGSLANTPVAAEDDALLSIVEAEPDSVAERHDYIVEYVVRTDETLFEIAERYRTDVDAIASTSGIDPEASLPVGFVLQIPTTREAALLAESAPAASEAPLWLSRPEEAEAAVEDSDLPDEPVSLPSESREEDWVELAANEPIVSETSSFVDRIAEPTEDFASATDDREKTPALEATAFPRDGREIASVALPTIADEPLADLADTEPVEPAASEEISFDAIVTFERPDGSTLPLKSLATDKASEDEVDRPRVAGSAPKSRIATVHRVVSGDTVDEIARLYGVSRVEIVARNSLSDPNAIADGDVLIIPPEEEVPTQSATYTAEVPSVILPDEASVPQEMPVVPLDLDGSAAGFSSDSSAEPASESDVDAQIHLEGLQGEIARLRQKQDLAEAERKLYLAANAESATESPDRGEVADRRRNVEFSSDRNTPRYAGGIDLETEATISNKPVRSFAGDREEISARPAFSGTYSTFLPDLQEVSPSLPALPGYDNYLPEGKPVFEGYIWPAQGVLTSGYGPRWGRMHKGIDIAAPTGTPIHAAAPGTVSYARWNSGGYGNLVEIEHPDGSYTLYAHNNRILVEEGQEVDQGEMISEMGSTGFSTGPHLHFEIHPPGENAQDPLAYLPDR